MNIGEEHRTVIVEPVKPPIPLKEPSPSPAPEREPAPVTPDREPEKVGVRAE